MKPLVSAAFRWKIILSFVLLATLLILLIGQLVISGALPIKMVMGYSNSEANFIQLWVKVAVLIGILLPLIALLIWIRHPESRNVFGFYLLVLIIQIVTEQLLSKMLFPSIVVMIGTIYTGFRLWQLWQGLQLVTTAYRLGTRSRSLLNGVVWLLLLFWSINLVVILVLSWPSIV